MYRLYVERKPGFENEAKRIYSEITGFLGIRSVTGIRYLNRYDVENVSEGIFKASANRIFSEPQSDSVVFETLEIPQNVTCITWEYLPGQYDQRADSAEQCLTLLREGLKDSVAVGKEPPRVRCAKIVLLEGEVSASDVEKIQHYLINPVDSRLTGSEKPETLEMKVSEPGDIATVEGFTTLDAAGLSDLRTRLGLAMDDADVKWMQDYFVSKHRDPTITEIRVLDTYWSDHCRHTTFATELTDIQFDNGQYRELIEDVFKQYLNDHKEQYEGRNDKYVCLMDIGTLAAKRIHLGQANEDDRPPHQADSHQAIVSRRLCRRRACCVGGGPTRASSGGTTASRQRVCALLEVAGPTLEALFPEKRTPTVRGR